MTSQLCDVTQWCCHKAEILQCSDVTVLVSQCDDVSVVMSQCWCRSVMMSV